MLPIAIAGFLQWALLVGAENSIWRFRVIVPQQGDSALDVRVGNGDGTFQAPVIANAGPVPTPLQLNVADFNRDGKPDLVSGYVTGFQLFLGNGDGTLQQPVATAEPNGFGRTFVVADFNGGNADISCYLECLPLSRSARERHRLTLIMAERDWLEHLFCETVVTDPVGG